MRVTALCALFIQKRVLTLAYGAVQPAVVTVIAREQQYRWCQPLTRACQNTVVTFAETTRLSQQFAPTRQRRIAVRRAVIAHSGYARQLLFRLLTSLLGGAVHVVLCRNLQRRLSTQELVYVSLQAQRVFTLMPASAAALRRADGYPWRFGAMALYLAVAMRDATILVAWLQSRVRAMSLFQHRRFFRTLAVTLRTAVVSPQWRYRLAGMRLYLVGKISVTGNAMSRIFSLRAGVQGNATLALRTSQAFTIIRTRTGCLGLTLGFFF
jgi:hypothetical protein